MEARRKVELEFKHIPRVLSYGLILCAIMIIFSVDYLFREKKYTELAVTTVLFIIILLIIRRINNK